MQRFKQAVGDILLAQAAPLTEFELIQVLQKEPYELLSDTALRGSLSLFQTHFLLFHCLYKLRDEWREERICDLRIEPLAIECQPWGALTEQAGLATQDPLRAYYLNWQNFNDTAESDVEALLDSFWQRFASEGRSVTADERSQAMVVMELVAMPDNLSQLKRHYRGLVHRYHPDKGGSAEEMQSIQWAYRILTQALRHGISSI